jgi:hypothetical protein
MKVGLVFACGPEGTDKKVCLTLAVKLDSKIDYMPITLVCAEGHRA